MTLRPGDPGFVPDEDDPSPLKYLNVDIRTAEETNMTHVRNFHTVRSCLIRGETYVVLERFGELTPEFESRISLPHNPKKDIAVPFELAWRHWYRPPRNSDEGDDNSMPPFEELDALRDTEFDGIKLHWRKVLGRGGFGVATLWDVEFEDETRRKLVIKIPKHPNFDASKEMSWHRRYAGASHCVQPVDIVGMVNQVRTNGHIVEPIWSNEGLIPEDLNVALLEYAELGDLYQMMTRAAHQGNLFTPKMLWAFWENLVYGVASVAYQPWLLSQNRSIDDIIREGERNGEDWIRQQLSEVPVSHDVHLDLEEQNILVAADPNHPHKPILKLHDFSDEWSAKMRERWRRPDEWQYWRLRHNPKFYRRLPEQHTKDWDKLSTAVRMGADFYRGDDLEHGSETAGRYGSWSNVFLIGQVMESIVTKIVHSHPFRKVPYSAPDAPSSTTETYACRLLEPHPILDDELREEIIKCQFHRPRDRPHILQLLINVVARKRRGFPGKSDTNTRHRWRLLWEGLPEPTPENNEPVEGGGDRQDGNRQDGNRQGVEVRRPGRGAFARRGRQTRAWRGRWRARPRTAGGAAPARDVNMGDRPQPSNKRKSNSSEMETSVKRVRASGSLPPAIQNLANRAAALEASQVVEGSDANMRDVSGARNAT